MSDEQRGSEAEGPGPGVESEADGGIRIDSLSEGAVATGERVRAEDRSQGIGPMSGGAVPYGRDAQAADTSLHFADPAQAQRLADAARQLRERVQLFATASAGGAAAAAFAQTVSGLLA